MTNEDRFNKAERRLSAYIGEEVIEALEEYVDALIAIRIAESKREDNV